MEGLIKDNKNINIIVLGTNIFIEKVNELIDIWAKINLQELEYNEAILNIINCYNFEENKEIENIKEKHENILKTEGIEELYNKELLKKAN